MNTQLDMTRVPLHQLALSPRNARKTGGADIDGLAASIAAHGLLQNLTVVVNDNPGDGSMQVFEVVAGGRRLAALQQLQRDGRMAADAPIPVRIIADDDIALEASTAENTMRENMHPADQFDAFKAMVDAKKPIEDIAAHFGVTELFVKQRLKLANVAPDLFAIYREGRMQLSQLQALAATDDHDAQRRAWGGPELQDWQREAHHIRRRMADGGINANNPVARYVGLHAYEAAGGVVRRDLFSGDTWCEDRALLDKLALDRMEAHAQQLRDAGWAWVDTFPELHTGFLATYGYLADAEPEDDCVLPEDQRRRLDAIEERIQAIGDIDADDLSNEQERALDEELEALQDEGQQIEAVAEQRWPAAAMQQSGVVIGIDTDGDLTISYARIRPGQRPGAAAPNLGASQAQPGKGDKPKPKKPELSAAVLLNLSAHRSEVARHHVRKDPHLALALLVDMLISDLKHEHSSAGVLRFNTLSARDPRNGIAPDIHKALAAEENAGAACFKPIPRKDRLAWLVKQPQADLLQLLAYALATRFDGLTESTDGHKGIDQLHAIIGFNMADHWNPGCDNFLARIPAALTLQAVTEAKGKDAAATLTGLKKDALVAQAAKLLAGTGWLPAPLRGPGYAAKAATAPAAAAKGKRKPANKAAKTKGKKPAAKKPAAKKATPKTKRKEG